MNLRSLFNRKSGVVGESSAGLQIVPLVAEYQGQALEAIIGQNRSFRVGQKLVVESKSGVGKLAIVFEDDGDTGYLYACDFANRGEPILDALHIYNADGVKNAQVPLDLKLCWSSDGTKGICLIDNYPHAAVDFQAKAGYCRTNFPPVHGLWAQHRSDHAWDDAVLDLFRNGG